MQTLLMPTADTEQVSILRWFSRLTAAVAVALVAVTWRLWIPQSRFPQVPLFAAAGRLPYWVEWAAGGTMVAGLCMAIAFAATSRGRRISLLWFVIATAVLLVIDQHRLQTWVWQFLLIAWVLSTTDERRAVGLLQWLVVSIYVYSALSKLDASFINGEGQQILSGLLRSVGLTSDEWSESARRLVTAGMPAGELAVAVGLCLRRTRRWALVAAVAMHTALFLALGPWGLRHKPGVLIWNVFFVLQDLMLFARRSVMPIAEFWSLPVRRLLFGHRRTGPSSPRSESPASGRLHRWRTHAAEIVVVAAMLLPLLEPFGWFDQWPSWGLYASAPPRLAVFVRCSEVGDLPSAIVRHVEAPPPLHSWCRLRIDRWSLDAVGAPLYPQNRFRVGVALAVAERYHLVSAIRVIVESSANRWTGRRTVRIFEGEADLREFADQFLLNARPCPLP